MMTNTTLVSLAFLKMNWDINKTNYLDNFIPFAIESLKDFNVDIISTQALQKQILDNFGIQIPINVIKSLLFRLCKKGIVAVNNYIFYRNNEKLIDKEFVTIQKDVQKSYSDLINDIRNYSQRTHNTRLLESDVERILLSFISFNQIALFQPNPSDNIFPSIKGLSQKERLIISDYINNLNQTNSPLLNNLETIAIGYMIANALYLPDLQNANKKFQRTRIFFDTSFIIYALGYGGEEMKIPALELLNLLRINGAQLFCFSHTLEEIKGIFLACISKLGHIEDTPFGRTVHFFTINGFTPSDIQLLVSKLERNLENLHIKVIDKPDFKEHKYIIDEKLLFSEIKANMLYPKDNAIQKDVDSIAAIYRFRKGNVCTKIEDSKALFVTTNNTLASISKNLYYKENDISTIPPCLTDYTLTNIVWLKTPTQAPALPTKRLIADCYAAIQPNERVMKKWFAEIEKLERGQEVSEEDYYFMRYSPEIQNSIMEISLGFPDAITEGTVPQIIERARQKNIGEVNKVLQEQKDKTRVIEEKYTEELKSKQKNEYLLEKKIKDYSSKIAYIISRILQIGLIIILFTGTLLTFQQDFFRKNIIKSIAANPLTFFLFIFFIISIIFNIANLIFGVSVISLTNKIEIKLEKYFELKLIKFFHV